MSIDSYFKRSSKVIDDGPTPECSPHPSESSGLITAIPTTGNPPPKSSKQGAGATGQLPPILVLNPSTRLADTEEKEEKESSKTKAQSAPRKEHPSWEMELTLLLTPMRPSQPDPQLTLMMTAFLWTLLELRVAKRKVAMRKMKLQQLLLRRSTKQATPIILVAAAPFNSAASVTSTPRTSPALQRRRRLARRFGLSIW